MKFKFIVLTSLLAISFAGVAVDNISYTYSTTKDKGLHLQFPNLGELKINTDVECGYIKDSALYASFGLEAQIYRCSKAVFSFAGSTNNQAEDNNWFFKLDAAPLYDSIKAERKVIKNYSNDSQGRPIDGNNHHVDWYKNLGSRLYYLGSVPIIEAYIGYQTRLHQIKVGRLKSIIGFDDTEVFFGDDAKFAPMGYWLSKDLFSGASYKFDHNLFEVLGAVYSGGNPTKGSSNYLDHVESPNLKSNNTISYAGKIKFKYDNFLGKNFNGYLFASYLSNITGSTWSNELKDGKRNASIYAHGATIEYLIGNRYIDSISLFGQYNQYLSGLRTKSSQNDGSSKFKDIKQKGYFIGSELNCFDKKVSLGVGYEKMDRFDYGVLARFIKDNPVVTNDIKKAKQSSLIFQAKYKINSIVAVVFAFHKITNPLLYVSDILDTHKTNRMKVGIEVKL